MPAQAPSLRQIYGGTGARSLSFASGIDARIVGGEGGLTRYVTEYTGGQVAYISGNLSNVNIFLSISSMPVLYRFNSISVLSDRFWEHSSCDKTWSNLLHPIRPHRHTA